MFKWAATTFTSRSFGSRSVQPQDSKYWTAYKNGPNGRQTVLLDFSQMPAERKDFGVLFPVMDALNHEPTSPVEWSFDPGRFTLKTLAAAPAQLQIYNNYGPKPNAELLMGYGFCIPANPHDCVLETLKPPPQTLQLLLRNSHPGYFKTNGQWNPEAATFQLRSPSSTPSANTTIWDSIPTPLIELFYYIVRYERGLDVTPIDPSTLNNDPSEASNDSRSSQLADSLVSTFLHSGPGKRYLPRIAFYLVSSLAPKLQKIQNATAALPSGGTPRNSKQAMAKIYRDGQVTIMSSIREGLGVWNRSLRAPALLGPKQDLRGLRTGAVWTLSEVLAVFRACDEGRFKEFVKGVGLEGADVDTLGASDAEQRIWVLLACYLTLCASSTEDEQGAGSLVGRWAKSLEAEYGEPFPAGADEDEEVRAGQDRAPEPESEPFLHVVRSANEKVGDAGSLWRSKRWTSDFVLDWGLRIVRSQGMLMRVVEGDVRYVIYLHVEQ